jgi:DNA topoisomerase-1
MKLVVIESPGKIKKLESFLPDDYRVLASFGHITEIPKSGLNIRLSDRTFKPMIVFRESQRSVLKDIEDYAKASDEVIICTDPDREGERIAFDIACLVGKDKPIKRAVFNEITKEAVLKALDNPTRINMNTVSSQLARSILDRIIGYIVSPKLWENVANGTSAGRVQSVALKLLAEREAEIQAFKPDTFWYLDADFEGFTARYKDVENDESRFVCEDDLKKVLASCDKANFVVEQNKKTKRKAKSYAPFDTSSLQQAASVSFGWSGKKTMDVAQKLYEEGLITYMRTDSFSIAEQAVENCREFIQSNYGSEYLPKSPKKYEKKTKSQEAHECIRPTGLEYDEWNSIDDLNDEQKDLLNLIRNRFIACQMEDMKVSKNEIIVSAGDHKFFAEGKEVVFDGWSKVWPVKDKGVLLPVLKKGDEVLCLKFDSKKSSTKPPSRYNDASLVAKMEKEGVGRPSTWASTIETLLKKKYAQKDKRNFMVTDLGKDVYGYLEKEYSTFFMDINFTSKVEDALDKIESGELDKHEVIEEFYLELKKLLDEQKERPLNNFLE